MIRSLVVFALIVFPAAATAGPRAGKPGPDPVALAAAIDQLIEAKLRAAGVPPAPVADDATYFRRVHLALGGRVPSAAEVREFLADPDPGKRAAVVDRLLGSAAYANHMTTTWRGWLLPEAATNPDVAAVAPAFEVWLRSRVRADTPFDQLVTELLTAPLNGRPVARGSPAADPDVDAGVVGFYTAKEGRPENLAAATARVFLGVQLECAQCHDHPFARWTRDQFWGVAAFFAGVERQGGAVREIAGRRELLIPNSDRTVPATFLDDREPEWQFKKSPRVTLAAWVTAAENPFFARAAVNRLWGFLYGVGIVDPIDDLHDRNPPSHPELLDALAAGFVASGFDVKFVLRAICLSRAFQRDSTVTEPGQRDLRLFARFPVQALTPEQLYDSLAVATGAPPDEAATAGRRPFLEAFALTGRRTESPTTVLQALTMMNGDLVGRATTPGGGRTLTAVVELPGLTPAGRVETLYLAALGRPPRPEELRRAIGHIEVEAGGVAGDKMKERYADVFWALLNGVEFRTNH